MNLSRQSILPKVLTIYMLAALLWWSYLLFNKTKDVTETKIALLQLESNVIHKVNNYDISSLDEYKKLISKNGRQQYMIIGEGLVFAFTLIVGIYLINKAHLRQFENQINQSNFLLSVTHELRSPLSSIMLILDTFKKRNLETDKIQDLAGDALKEGKRLDNQIKNLLLATKLDNNYVLHLQPTDVKEMIEKTIIQFSQKYPRAALVYTTNGNAQDVMVDQESFQSLMNNLLENAIKYTEFGRKISVDLSYHPSHIIISVIDEGIGIPNNEKDKVFDQFYRVGNEETRKSQGTGLGLYIVKQIVNAHRGIIEIEDNEPQGSRFIIKFPNA